MDRSQLLDPWVWARIGFIYLLVGLVAGGIAYLGNKMGRNIGKKRMSILGMRPRHTSNFITAVTGSLIAMTTLTLAALFSEQVRQLLLGIDRLRNELNTLQRKVDEEHFQLTQSRVVWGTGQPILTGVLQPGVPASTQRMRLLNSLDSANFQSVTSNNRIAAEKGESKLDMDTQLVVWDESQIQELAERMMSESNVMGVRILAAQNCLYRDKVPVRLELLPVTRLFSEGDVVASLAVQPDNPEILREWYAFLDRIHEAALHRGMIEVNGSLGGGLSSEDFDRLIQDIKRLQGPGRLVAVAKYDLYETSPLAIRIEVRADTPESNH